MPQALTGLKIKALRKARGLTQHELARRAGISASYVNLIEANKRPVPMALLDRIAVALDGDRAELDGESERRRLHNLNEIASDPAIANGRADPAGAEELIGRQPEWAEIILNLYRAYRDRNEAVLALADRLNRDPFLGESIHSVLTRVTSIRSAAEILIDNDSLGAPDRQRFLSIISDDSGRLSDTARELVAFFGNTDTRVRSATPMENVDAFISDADNHFPTLENVAETFLRSFGGGAGAAQEASRIVAEGGAAAAEPTPKGRFALMRKAAEELASDAVQAIVAEHSSLGSDVARELAANALYSYVAGAILMPYEAFARAALDLRCDLDQLMELFGVSYEQAAHRLATLRRPGAEGVHFAYMRSDPSGYVTKRLPLPGLHLPRYGTACPLWAIYGAFQTPGVTVRHFGALPSGDEFLFFARAVDKSPATIGRPRHLQSILLACAASEADRVVYGDGIDRAQATIPVGTVCRLCSRETCRHRQEKPLLV